MREARILKKREIVKEVLENSYFDEEQKESSSQSYNASSCCDNESVEADDCVFESQRASRLSEYMKQNACYFASNQKPKLDADSGG